MPVAVVESYQESLVSKSESPRDIKLQMAHAVVALLHDSNKADIAASEFVRIFSDKEKPTDIPEFRIMGSRSIAAVLVEIGFSASKSEVRRLIDQQGVKMNDVIVTDSEVEVLNGAVIQKGKRFFARIIASA